MTFLDLFSLGFMQRALLAAVFTGLAAPAVGTYLVQRRLALMGDGIGHVAVTGVAVGLVTGTSPTWTAVVVAVLGAVAIEVIRERGHTNGDVALALLFYGGLAGGVLHDRSRREGRGQSAAVPLRLDHHDHQPPTSSPRWLLAAVVVVVCVGLSPQLFAVAQDQEFARVAGLRVRAYNVLVAVLAAVSVTVAMRTVGLLLVSALMVVPVATAQQLTRSFRTTLGAAMALGVVASLGGLVLSAYASFHATWHPGRRSCCWRSPASWCTWPVGVWLRHRQRLTAPFPSRAMTTRARPRGRAPARPRPRLRAPGRAARGPRRLRARRAPARSRTESTMTSTDSADPSGGPLRPTRQRRAVAEAMASFDDFRSAQEIHELLAERGETVGLATVYRTLQRLAEAGEIDMLRTEDGEAIYRRCSDSHHHHLVCRGCGRTVEVEGPAVERWTRAIADEHGFADVSHELEIFGTCPSCA